MLPSRTIWPSAASMRTADTAAAMTWHRSAYRAFIAASYAGGLQGDAELRRSLRLHILELHAGMELLQHQPLAGLDLEHAQVGDDHVHHGLARHRQRAALEHLGGAVLGGVLHQHHDALHARDE